MRAMNRVVLCVLQVSLEAALLFTCLHFKRKGVYLINISNLVNIGTVRVPSGELGDVFINPGALYGAAVFIGRWYFLSLVSPEQVGGLSAKISARFLNQPLKVPPNFTPDDHCPCPRNQLSHA